MLKHCCSKMNPIIGLLLITTVLTADLNIIRHAKKNEKEERFSRTYEYDVDYSWYSSSEEPLDYDSTTDWMMEESTNVFPYEEYSTEVQIQAHEEVQEDVVTKFLRIVESQQELGDNCTAGTDLNLGEGVVDRYAQERFRIEAEVAVNRANMLTRLWKYAERRVMESEYLLHASIFSMVEFNENIFAAGNCYDKYQYKSYELFCPYAYRLPEGPVLAKNLALEYNYLGNTSEWFYLARKNAEKIVIKNKQFSYAFNTYTYNGSTHTKRVADEILSVKYEDGRWSKPYYDCGGGHIWMLTYTVPFFGYRNGTYFFKGTSGIDIDLRRVDIDQCPLPEREKNLNIFAASDKCKKETTYCVSIKGLGFRRGSYNCVCQRGFYFPNNTIDHDFFDGIIIEEEYEKLILGEPSLYNVSGMFECIPCAEGCETCIDGRPCVLALNWFLRSIILGLSCLIILFLSIVELFIWRYRYVKVVRAASPVLLRVIALGALFIYCTTIVMYPIPSLITCTLRLWLREVGFSLTYGALMLKTWRFLNNFPIFNPIIYKNYFHYPIFIPPPIHNWLTMGVTTKMNLFKLISIIFRVRSARAVKITDMDLLKKLGIILLVFSTFLVIRTIVAPPIVITVRTADDLKAFLCETTWWDHWFSIMEALFLAWGIRLCIVVRKAPSEFNESRFISMAIYNEFLLSIFLNVSMFFLHAPTNPDLLYIIWFCHTQITITLLLCFIFGSKAYMVFKGHGKAPNGGTNMMKIKHPANKYLTKPPLSTASQTFPSTSSINVSCTTDTRLTETDIQDEILNICKQLELLKDKNGRYGNRKLASKLNALHDFLRGFEEVSVEDESTSSMVAVAEEAKVKSFALDKSDAKNLNYSSNKKLFGNLSLKRYLCRKSNLSYNSSLQSHTSIDIKMDNAHTVVFSAEDKSECKQVSL